MTYKTNWIALSKNGSENICRDPFASANNTKKRFKIEIDNFSAINY